MPFIKNLIFVLLTILSGSVSAQLAADFSADHISGCAPIRVVFASKSSGTNAATDYRWNLGNGTIAQHTSSPSVVYLQPGVYTVKLTVINGSDSATIIKTNYIIAYANPQVNFGGLPVKGCSPMTVLFDDSSKAGSGEMANWKWDFGDGFLGTGSNPSHVYKSPGSFKVTLIAGNSKGCQSFFSRLDYVNVFNPTEVRFTQTAPATCTVPATFKFADNSTGTPIIKYAWNFGDGSTSTEKNPSHVYTVSGSYPVKLVVENSFGCKDSSANTSVANAGNFHADFITMPEVCAGIPAMLTNISSPANLLQSSLWDFGNGSFSNTQHATVSYNMADTFTIKLVSTIGGCLDSAIKKIIVHPKPVVDFTAVTTGACKPPFSVQFNNKTVGGTVVKWYLGNGDSSTLNNPIATYNNYGAYDVRLIVKNTNGCLDTLTKSGFISIKEPVADSIRGLPRGGCIPFTDTFSVALTSPENIVKYEWDLGDGTKSTEKNPINSYTKVGIYKVWVKITTASGCTDSISSTVSGGIKPNAAFTAKPRPIVCPKDYVQFTTLDTTNIDAWQWDFGDGGTSIERDPVHIYNDTGWMKVMLVVSDGGCTDTLVYPKYIYVKPPIAKIADAFICGNQFTHYFTSKDLGAKIWKWIIDGKAEIEKKDISYTFSEVGLHTVKLYVTNEPCFDDKTIQVMVLDEKADFTSTEPVDCRNPDVVFTVGGPKTNHLNIRQYQWDFGDSTGLITTNSQIIGHRYAKAGIVQVKLIITDLNGCKDSIVKFLKVGKYGPAANFGPAFTAICAGKTVSFSDSSTAATFGPIIKWVWNFGTGPDVSFTAPPFSYKYTTAGVYDVSLVVENAAGCRDTVVRPRAVIVYKPMAAFVSPDTLICENAPARFYNQSQGRQIRSAWSFGDGNNSQEFHAENKYARAGFYDVMLVVTDSLNCADSALKPKYIHVANAQACFAVSDSFSSCPPLLVGFSNSSVNNMFNYWDFANGNSSTLANPSHTYVTAGDFNIKLKVIGNGGCSDSAYKRIRILGPTGTFSYSPLYQCVPLKASFSSYTKNATRITWDFSDGETIVGSTSKATHIYKNEGQFVPRLILTDDRGCQVPIQGLDTIKTFEAKAYVKSLPSQGFCDSVTVQFFDSTVTNDIITSFKWSFDDGTQSKDRNPVHIYKKLGFYNVAFEIRTLGGCVSAHTVPQPIVVASTPKVFIGNDSSVCVPNVIQFSGVAQNKDGLPLTYKWGFGNSESSSLLQPLPVKYKLPGKYVVALTATNQYGCAGIANKILTVNDTPRVTANPAAYICLGKSVALTAAGANVYMWDSHPSLSCINCAVNIAKPSAKQMYRVTGTDTNGCKASGTVFVNVKPPAKLLVGPGDTLCVGESFRLVSSGTELYKWEPQAGLTSNKVSNPLATPHASTLYKIVGYDSLGCFYDTGYVSVVVYPIPKFDIVEEKIVASTGSIVSLKTESSADITQWRWLPPVGLSCTNCAEPKLIVARPITYTAGVSNNGGCTAQDKVTVLPVCNKENIFVPNTFSPNGDGQNDVFYPRGKGLAAIKAMRIFNRWGQLLFEQKDFAVNDASSGWDGTHTGVKLTADVYVYILDVVCENNTVFNMKGNITLLR